MKSCCPKNWGNFFKAIHDDHRQFILDLLRKYGRMNANQIVEKLSLSQPTISHHLKILHQAKILNADKKGKEVIYSINDESIKECCGGFIERFAEEKK